MAYSAKSSLMAWFILVFMALMLFYRNHKYDRLVAFLVFFFGLIEIIEYGVFNGADLTQSALDIYIVLWLQCLLLSICTYFYIGTLVTLNDEIFKFLAFCNMILFIFVFAVILLHSFTNTSDYKCKVEKNHFVEWSKNDDDFLGKWMWLYAFGIIFPFFILLGYYDWSDFGLTIIILYGLLSAAYNMIYRSSKIFGSAMCYQSIIFAFIAWSIDIVECTA